MGAAAHVFVDDLSSPELGADDRHHLQRVLRLRAGEQVTVSNGRGGWRRCEFVPPGRLAPVDEVRVAAPPAPAITIGFALTKGERPEWTAQKLAEAGVDRIVPMVTARTVVHWEGEKASRQLHRLRAVVRAAAMQSRQAWLPVVSDVVPFEALVEDGDVAACLAQPGGGPPSLHRPVVLVGPEGGWDDDELVCGLPAVGLGPTVLRAETAAMAAAVLLCGLRAGVVGPGAGGR